MTEHTNIPLPPEGEEPESGKSLRERPGTLAGGTEGVTSGFRPAPVPKELAARPRKRGEGRRRPSADAVAAATSPASYVSTAPDAAPTSPPAEPVLFAGPKLKVGRER